MGEQVLATAQAVAFSPTLPAQTPDLVYSQTPGGLTLAYPPWVGWLILAGGRGPDRLAPSCRARRIEAFAWTRRRPRRRRAACSRCVGRLRGAAFRAPGHRRGVRLPGAAVPAGPGDRWEAAVMLLGLGVPDLRRRRTRPRPARHRPRCRWPPGLGSCAASAASTSSAWAWASPPRSSAVAAYGRPVSRPGAWTGRPAARPGRSPSPPRSLAPVAAFVIAWPLALAAPGRGGQRAQRPARRRGASRSLAPLAAARRWPGSAAWRTPSTWPRPAELLACRCCWRAPVLWPLAQPDEGAPPARLVGPDPAARGPRRAARRALQPPL